MYTASKTSKFGRIFRNNLELIEHVANLIKNAEEILAQVLGESSVALLKNYASKMDFIRDKIHEMINLFVVIAAVDRDACILQSMLLKPICIAHNQ